MHLMTIGAGYVAENRCHARAPMTDELRKYYYWLECDCREENGIYPVLFCVQNRGIRRDPKGVQHAHECDFHFYPSEQVELVETYKNLGRRELKRSFNLLRDFGVGEALQYSVGTKTSQGEPRSEIAMLLVSLLGLAGLDMITPSEGPYWNLNEQIARIRAASLLLTISGRRLSDWIAVNSQDYEKLKTRIAEANHSGGQRHYGLYIFSPVEITNKTFQQYDGEPLTVFGHVATTGEDSHFDRHHYLVAAVVSAVDHRGPVGLVRAYVHPCVSPYRWTLVDSNLEKEALKQLLKIRYHLHLKHDLQLYIQKPLFDMGPDDNTPRGVCIPDFVLMPRDPALHKNCVIIEAMGGRDEMYADRKGRMHAMFEQIGQPTGLSDTKIEEYEPPEGALRDEYDRDFRKRVCSRVLDLVPEG